MSEWKPFESAPKDGSCFLACTEEDVFLIQWEKDRNGWRCSPGHTVFVKFTHWMEAPELPVKKHECLSDHITCFLEEGKLYVNIRGNSNRNTYQVRFCPICGEKA